MTFGRGLFIATVVLGAALGTGWLARPDLVSQVTGRAIDAAAALGAAATSSGKNPSAAGSAKSAGERQITVEAAMVRQADTSIDIRAVGSLLSDEAVILAPELSGRLSEILFREGQPVKTGDILAKLDDALAQAEVTDAQARLTLAAANNERARSLSRSGAGTVRVRDESIAAFETSQAALELARTRLAKHVLRAPFDGTVGVRSVSAGAFVSAGTAIVNLEKIDTLKVEFKVPEIHLQDVKVGQKISVEVDAVPGRTFEGEIYAINPLLDVNGRALQVRARLANLEMVLRPGLFVRIAITGITRRGVIMVPEAAIVPRGGDAFVFRVADGKAVETRIKIGQRANAEVEVLEGLDAGTMVVTAGQQKLRNGDRIEVLPAEPAAAQPSKKDVSQSPTAGRRS